MSTQSFQNWNQSIIKGQAFCQSLFSTWFCGRGRVCHHESEIEVVGELAEFCKKADFL